MDARLQVICDDDPGNGGVPRLFYIGPRRRQVREVLDRWLDTRHRYYKVRADDDGIYILRHDVAPDRWKLTLFDSGTREETRLSST